MKKPKDIESALATFEDAAAKHAEGTEGGDYRKCNRCYGIIEDSVAHLKNYGALLRLEAFLKHSCVGVRMWAARYLLPIRETESVRALEEIAAAAGIHGLTAKTTLSEWQNGNLKP